MKKIILSAFSACLAFLLMADSLVGSSKPFSVNTMVGDFKILDVKSDYCSGEYGKSGKQTFLSGVKCELEFTVSTTPFYDVDYITVNGEVYHYPKFKYNVGKLGSGGAMNVVAVSKDGEKTKSFRVNLDVAKPHKTMVKPYVADWKKDELVYKSLYDGLAVTDLAKFSFYSYNEMNPLNVLPFDMTFSGPVRMYSQFDSDSSRCKLEQVLPAVPVGKIVSTAVKSKNKLLQNIEVKMLGGSTWKWNNQRNDYSKEKSLKGVRLEFDCLLGKELPIYYVFFVKAGLKGTVDLKSVEFRDGTGDWRFEYSGNPTLYGRFSVGTDRILSAGANLNGKLIIEGGAPPRPNYIDKLGLEVSASASLKAVSGLELEWPKINLYETTWVKGGGKKLLTGISRKDEEMVSLGILNTPFDVASGYDPTLATLENWDVLAYHVQLSSRMGVNKWSLCYKSGIDNEWTTEETVWDDGTIDGVANIGVAEGNEVVLAWENGRNVLDEDVTIQHVLKNFEMAVALRDPSTGVWSAKNLTNDSTYNHSPRVVVPQAGNGYLVFWLSTDIENAGDEFVKPSRLMCARHVGDGNWKIKEIARSVSLPLISYDVKCGQGGRFELMWAECDYEVGLQKIHYVTENGTIGSSGFGTISASALGEKEIGIMPRFVDENCGSKIVWVEDGKLHTSPTVSFASPIVVDLGSTDVPPSFAAVNGGGETALVWTEVDASDPAHPNHAYALMYDSSEGRWGYPVRITDDVRDESQVKASIGDDKAIRLAYVATDVSTNGTGEVVTGASSLETHYSPTKCELVVEENCFELPTKEFTMDKEYEVHTTIKNKGRRGSNGDVDILVGLYESDGETALTGDESSPYAHISFAGGETVVLTNKVELRGASVDSRELFVMIDPYYKRRNEDGLDIDYWSDEVWLNIGKPRLELSQVEAQYDSSTNCFLTAKLKNTGTLAYPEGAKVLFHRGSVDGPIIGEDAVPAIPPGVLGEYSAGIAWDMSKTSFASANETIYAVLDVSDVELDDESEGDGGTSGTEEPSMASVDVVTPLDSNGNGIWDGEEQMLAVPGSYAIEYSLGEGSNASSNPSSYTTNDLPIKLAEPTKNGYTFVGWIQGSGLIECGTTGNLLFTAVWEKDGATPDFVIEKGVLKAATLNGAVRVTIPDGVNVIAPEAFYDVSGLFRVTIPNSVTNIGERAFNGVGEVLFTDRTAPLQIAESAIVPASAVTVMPRSGGLSFVGWMDEVDMFLSDPFGQPGGCFVRPIWTTGPANDNFARASSVSGAMGSCVCNNVGVTSESGEPLIAFEPTATASVWWRWIAPQSGQFRFFTSGSGFDTVMGIYKGAVLSTLERVAENDDAENTADGSSSVLFEAESGVTYYISVAGKDGATGSIMLNWEPQGSYVWQYEQVDGGVEITGVIPQPEGELTFPEELDGHPVVQIGWGAFRDCPNITCVKIPGSVKTLDGRAFEGCGDLKTVELAPGVMNIEGSAFENCISLSEVILPNTVTNIGNMAFSWCESLSEVEIPESVVKIGGGAFQDCAEGLYDTTTIPGVKIVDGWAVGGDSDALLQNSLIIKGIRGIGDGAFYRWANSLTSVEIGDGVLYVGAGAFEDCEGIAAISISKDVRSIGREAFCGCSSLLAFSVAEDNENYASVDGLLCNKAVTVLVCCPGGVSTADIPPTITAIGDYSLAECQNLRQLSIPDGVTAIGEGAFDSCEKLGTVTVGSGVRDIYDEAFNWCGNLTNITFKGNAPRLHGRWVFSSLGDSCVAYVPYGSTGWGVSIPGTWNGMRIEYLPSTLMDRQVSIAPVLEQSGARGTVKMSPKNGVVKAGGTATLTAKAGNKNTVFAYWTDGDGNIVGYTATLKVKPDGDTTYNAVFRLKSKCERPMLREDVFSDGYPSQNSMVGVAYRAQIVVNEAAYPVKFSAKGLPKGLKINATTGVISGVPTKAGKFTAAVTVKSAANTKLKASSRKITIAIAKLPAWARGSFSGPMYLRHGYYSDIVGQATLSVGATGKISGKFVVHGTNWAVAVSSYSAESASDGGLLVASGMATRKVGKTTYKQPWMWQLEEPEAGADRFSVGMQNNGEHEFYVVRNNWKDVGPAILLRDWVGAYDWLAPDGAKLALTVGNGGIVKVTGTLGNGRKLSLSTPLLMEYEDMEYVLIYAPPAKVTTKNKKGKIIKTVSYPEFVACVQLHNEPGKPVPGGEFAYRRQGVRPEALSLYGEDPGSGTFKFSPPYGQAADGATVTVTAVPDKNSVFAYWMLGDDIVGYGTSYKLKMGDGDFTGLSAMFRNKNAFKARPEVPFVVMHENEVGEEVNPFDSLRVGVAFRANIEIDPDCRPVKFTAKNLPAGLKINATTGVISGVPTAAGTKIVSITAASVANPKLVSPALKVTTNTAKLDAWAKGTYTGKGTLAGKTATLTLTVGATGKVSGKFTVAKKFYAFSAASYAAHGDGVYSATAKVKYGSATYPLAIAVKKDNETGKGTAEIRVFDGETVVGSVDVVRK